MKKWLKIFSLALGLTGVGLFIYGTFAFEVFHTFYGVILFGIGFYTYYRLHGV